jgi:hypothetical protein
VPADRLEVALVQLEWIAAVELPFEKTEREKRRVSFVQMVVEIAGVAESAQDGRSTHSEHDLLAESIMRVAAVQIVGESAVGLVVLG